MKVKILKAFQCKETKSILKPNLIVYMTKERVEELNSTLSNHIEVAEDLESLTVKELRKLADERDIDLGEATKKDDIIKAIKEGD